MHALLLQETKQTTYSLKNEKQCTHAENVLYT